MVGAPGGQGDHVGPKIKGVGNDQIWNEAMQAGGPAYAEHMAGLLQKVAEKGQVPVDWHDGLGLPLSKLNSRRQMTCRSWKTLKYLVLISFLGIAVGIVTRTLRNVIHPVHDEFGAVEKGILTVNTVLMSPVVVALSWAALPSPPSPTPTLPSSTPTPSVATYCPTISLQGTVMCSGPPVVGRFKAMDG